MSVMGLFDLIGFFSSREERPVYQKATARKLNRGDHCWFQQSGGSYKCALCGAVCPSPPPYPTPGDWLPDRYERLTNDERNLCPDPSTSR